MIWIITDTHFGHDNIIEYCGRPKDYNERIVKAWRDKVSSQDTIIHMGDIRFGKGSDGWDSKIHGLPGNKILLRGNHDKNTSHKYHTQGWMLVVEGLLMGSEFGGVWITHRPARPEDWWNVNLHGHIHNAEERPYEGYNKIYIRFALEIHGYTPQPLDSFLQKEMKKHKKSRDEEWRR